MSAAAGEQFIDARLEDTGSTSATTWLLRALAAVQSYTGRGRRDHGFGPLSGNGGEEVVHGNGLAWDQSGVGLPGQGRHRSTTHY